MKLYAFTDFETSGLDIATLSPLEVAVKLCSVGPRGIIEPENVLFTYESLIQPLDPDWASKCHPAALELHKQNGLIDAFQEAESNGVTLPTVQEVSIAISNGFQGIYDSLGLPVNIHKPSPRRAVIGRLSRLIKRQRHWDGYPASKVQTHMAGMGVANYDRPLVRHHMKEWDSHLHYRSVDVSGFSEMMEAMGWGASSKNPIRNTVEHRAMADVNQGIEVFNYFSRNVSVSQKF